MLKLQANKTFIGVELWLSLLVFVFGAMYFVGLASDAGVTTADAPNRQDFENLGLPFHFLHHYFFPEIARYFSSYLVLAFLNFIALPGIIEKPNRKKYVGLAAIAVVLLFVTILICNYQYSQFLFESIDPSQAFATILSQAVESIIFVLTLFLGHSAIKYAGFVAIANDQTVRSYTFVANKDNIIGGVLFVLGVYYMVVAQLPMELMVTLVPVGLSTLLLHGYSFNKWLPSSLRSKSPTRFYVFRAFSYSIFSFFVIWTLLLVATGEAELPVAVSIFNSFFQFFIVAPVLYIWFRKSTKGKEMLLNLQRKLGKSEADLDFLKSQINPHFLFNALNTIYGTALQENAPRTSEAVERLGEMMRFMLHENLQDKIPLAKEIDYLKNYIELQKSRTNAIPSITITTRLPEIVPLNVQIAPMLLIPFVENAFKHGISFRGTSSIDIRLEYRNETIYFNVSNTKHKKTATDPERMSNGVGLNNVKERLSLLYADQHELAIIENENDFSVKLVVELRK